MATNPTGFRVKFGRRSFLLCNDSNGFHILKTAAGDLSGSWNTSRPLTITNDGAVYIEGFRVAQGTSINPSGWWRDERTGFMIQWGAVGIGNDQRVNFLRSFSTVCFSVPMLQSDSYNGTGSSANISATGKNKHGFISHIYSSEKISILASSRFVALIG